MLKRAGRCIEPERHASHDMWHIVKTGGTDKPPFPFHTPADLIGPQEPGTILAGLPLSFSQSYSMHAVLHKHRLTKKDSRWIGGHTSNSSTSSQRASTGLMTTFPISSNPVSSSFGEDEAERLRMLAFQRPSATPPACRMMRWKLPSRRWELLSRYALRENTTLVEPRAGVR